MTDKRYDLIMLNKIKRIFLATSILVVSFLVSVILHGMTFYIHEAGHIAFGSIGDIYTRENTIYNVTTWEKLPILVFVEYPQQTTPSNGNVNILFVYGGIILVIMFWFLISYLFYKKTKEKFYWLFFLIFALNELISNFLCGTDNIISNPYPVCDNVFLGNWGPIFLVSLTIITLIKIYNKNKR